MTTPTLTSAKSFNLNKGATAGSFYDATLTGVAKSAQAHISPLPTLPVGITGDTLVASSAATNATLYGGAGDDSLVALGTNNVLVQNQSAGHDTLVGNSTTTFVLGSASLLSNNSLVGAGNNTLKISAAGSINDAFDQVSGIQTLSLTGASSATLGANATAAGIDTVITGNGNTTIDASLSGGVTINASPNTKNATTLIGSASAGDSFILSNGTVLGKSSIVGGNTGTDALQITAAKGALSDALFARVRGVEVLSLTGTSSVTIATNASNAGISTIVAGTGATTINASAATNAVTMNASANTTSKKGDTLVGSSQGDTFIVSNGTMLGKSSIVGGAGTDALQIATAGTLGDSLFARIKTVETLSLTGGSSVTLAGNAVATGIETVYGGASASTVNASAVTRSLTIDASQNTGAGSYLIGGAAAASRFIVNGANFALNKIFGGSVTDTLQASSALITNDGFKNASSVEVLSLSSGNDQITLGSAAQAAGISTVIGGGGDDSFFQNASFTNGLTMI